MALAYAGPRRDFNDEEAVTDSSMQEHNATMHHVGDPDS